MESFNGFKRAPKSEMEPRANPVEINDNVATPNPEAGPDFAATNIELRSIIRDLAVIEDPMQRIPVFIRMLRGPEMGTDDPALLPFFDRISEVEDKYGREAVKEMATLYGAGRMSDTA